ncbi:monosaccharide-sensing protein 2-like [Dorcoceras hygrometricum]|uniref:Monosaccharide-sensing protein 2-like n=1 Tax=Dorcoceras hygrometricum TaxID=472368 RepID=A0A2Z7BDD3_9LAMI|nr:monosaccharide-sensing protein 2-like [Dorcoceras hygrometricum]
MSLFDLRDVCIAIGSLSTLDLPMVVDLIGIYGLKGPYCTLTTTDWFLQALSLALYISLEIAKRQRLDKLKRQRIDWLSISADGYSKLLSADDVNQQMHFKDNKTASLE